MGWQAELQREDGMKLDEALRDFAFAYLPCGRISVKRSLTIGLVAFCISWFERVWRRG